MEWKCYVREIFEELARGELQLRGGVDEDLAVDAIGALKVNRVDLLRTKAEIDYSSQDHWKAYRVLAHRRGRVYHKGLVHIGVALGDEARIVRFLWDRKHAVRVPSCRAEIPVAWRYDLPPGRTGPRWC